MPLLPAAILFFSFPLLQSSLKELYIIMVSNFFPAIFLEPRTSGFFSQTVKLFLMGPLGTPTELNQVSPWCSACWPVSSVWHYWSCLCLGAWSSAPNAHLVFLLCLWWIPLRCLYWFLLVFQLLHEGEPRTQSLVILSPYTLHPASPNVNHGIFVKTNWWKLWMKLQILFEFHKQSSEVLKVWLVWF